MTGLLLAAVVVAAVIAMAVRRLVRQRARRAAARLPGATAELAVPIRSWSDIEAHTRDRVCVCGTPLTMMGEGSRAVGGRRYRVARLACPRCEEEQDVFFDTTSLLH